jgi:DNA-binding beta-propeller fold protein YncE
MPFAVLVFNGVTNTFTETHPVGRCPFGSAYNPVTNRLYVTSYTDNTVLVLDASKMP